LPLAVFSDGVVFHGAAFYGESFPRLHSFSLGGVEVDSAFVEAFMEVVGFGPRARLV
jgi:preprotein translocase subunit SecF